MWTLPGNRHSFPKRPVDPVDLKRFFRHFPLLAGTLIRLMSWVTEEMWGKIISKCLHVTCRSRLQLNNFSVSGGRVMGNSKASLEGSITSIAACSFQTSTAFFYWLLSTRPSPPLHIDRLYSCFTYLHLCMSFLVCLWLEGLAMSQSWLAFRGWVPIRIIFANSSRIKGKVGLLVSRRLDDQLESRSGAPTMPKSFYS